MHYGRNLFQVYASLLLVCMMSYVNLCYFSLSEYVFVSLQVYSRHQEFLNTCVGQDFEMVN